MEYSKNTLDLVISRKDLVELRDKSGLSRQDFYVRMFEQAEQMEKTEVSGISLK